MPFDSSPATRPPFDVDISGFGDAMEVILPPETLSAAAVDALRDVAIAREARDLKGALKLMETALHHRPKGQGMIRKVAEYRRALAAAGGDPAG